MDDFIVTVDDLHHVRNQAGGQGFCVRGMKAWAASHGIDFRDFLENGIPASRLMATNDSIALELVESLRKEKNKWG